MPGAAAAGPNRRCCEPSEISGPLAGPHVSCKHMHRARETLVHSTALNDAARAASMYTVTQLAQCNTPSSGRARVQQNAVYTTVHVSADLQCRLQGRQLRCCLRWAAAALCTTHTVPACPQACQHSLGLSFCCHMLFLHLQHLCLSSPNMLGARIQCIEQARLCVLQAPASGCQ